ncbi:hypothetical protein HGRIS_010367 [Hohenbuehelia grisea]|uniref:Endoplasmic reticulum junction formation protein lunapark n=1 Tax=Hohenbuehelia grisea TaxID=104357 RepID=A0ABR3J5J9_9AGAR
MSFLRRLWSKPKEEDYETVLSVLARDIQSRQQKLSEIRLRERRATLLATLYTLATWVAYVSLWYFSILPNFYAGEHERRRKRSIERTLKGLPVVIGPIAILFIRRIVQIWYARKGDAEEKALQVALKKQRETVEEIKKKTNYYSTRELLSKYDEPQTPSPSPQQAPGLRKRAVVPSTPVRGPVPPSAFQSPVPQTPINPALRNHLAATPSTFPSTPPRKQWYDKLADALLGDEDQAGGPASSRYALICEKCFKHNGLVKESMWEDAQYMCPKCGHFNASARSKRQRSAANSLSPPTNTDVSSAGRSLPSSSPLSVTRELSPDRSVSTSPQARPNAGEETRGDEQTMDVDES